MDVKYFVDHIHEELGDAEEYAKKAIELRAQNPSWAKTFLDMSSAEISHATNFYKMFEEYYGMLTKANKEVPDYIQDAHAECTRCITDKVMSIKHLHDFFNK